MKKTTAMIMGLVMAVATIGVSSVQAADTPKNDAPPCLTGEGGQGKDCPLYGQGLGKGRGGMGQGLGQQHRYGLGKGQGPGQGQGKGFRGGPRDGSGPRRDGSCGQCPVKPS